MNNYVFSPAVDANGILYANGELFGAGNVSARNIDRWDGTP